MIRFLLATAIATGIVFSLSLAISRPGAIAAETAAPAGSAAAGSPGAAPSGLEITFTSADGKATDARESRLISLCVPKGTDPTPFIPPGAFKASWHGAINEKLRDEVTFTAHGRGDFELLVNGESVLKVSGDDLASKSSDLVKLKKGPNDIVANYTAPADGDAVIRLYWAERNHSAGSDCSHIFHLYTG